MIELGCAFEPVLWANIDSQRFQRWKGDTHLAPILENRIIDLRSKLGMLQDREIGILGPFGNLSVHACEKVRLVKEPSDKGTLRSSCVNPSHLGCVVSGHGLGFCENLTRALSALGASPNTRRRASSWDHSVLPCSRPCGKRSMRRCREGDFIASNSLEFVSRSFRLFSQNE